MITSINLGNFKSFGSVQKIPIRPLTLLYGPNNAGKSTCFHGIALSHEAIRTGNLDVANTEIGGTSIDLGGFSKFVFQNETNRLCEWGAEIQNERKKVENQYATDSIKSIEVGIKFGVPSDVSVGSDIKSPCVQSYVIGLDGLQVLRIERQKCGKLKIVDLSVKHEYFRQRAEIFLKYNNLSKLKPELYEHLNLPVTPKLFSSMKIFSGKFIPDVDPMILNFGDLRISNGEVKVPIETIFKSFIENSVDTLLYKISRQLKTEIQQFYYLGAIRSLPPRNLFLCKDSMLKFQNEDIYAWYSLIEDPKLRDSVNIWLSSDKQTTKYQLIVNHLFNLDKSILEHMEQLEDAGEIKVSQDGNLVNLDSLISSFNSNNASNLISELLLKDLRTNTVVSHTDVGIGVNQVLPVLVAAYVNQNKLVAIEQPESHVHPALQGDLADVFINSALGEQKNTILLETHSENLILRILKRIRQTTSNELPEGLAPITPNEVSVLYFEPEEFGTKVTPISIREDGEFQTRWPNGFFDERMEEFT